MTSKLRKIWFLIPIVVLGCAGAQKADAEAENAAKQKAAEKKAAQPQISATAILSPIGNSITTGMVKLQAKGNAVQLTAEFYGLTQGSHIARILEVKSCNLKEAYGDQVPDPAVDEPHVRDLGELVPEDEAGSAKIELPDSGLPLGGDNNTVGRAVVVYAGKEDLNYQDALSPDARIACGVFVSD